MIQVTALSKIFKTYASEVVALHNVSFEIPDGCFASIIGQSGSGKSTLLCMLGGLDKPTDGSINIGGKNITTLRDRQLTRYRGKHIGFVFQSFNLIPNLSALENVMLPMEFAGVRRRERKQRAIDLLATVGLTKEEQRRRPSRLSGGQQQRIAIARALANRPSVILADEPTGNLDSTTSQAIFNQLRDLSRKENTTVIFVTHDLGLAQQSDMLLSLKDGEVSKARLPDNRQQ